MSVPPGRFLALGTFQNHDDPLASFHAIFSMGLNPPELEHRLPEFILPRFRPKVAERSQPSEVADQRVIAAAAVQSPDGQPDVVALAHWAFGIVGHDGF
ncbi:MAG TPA: hypothetical protein VM165_06915, partial [Planctomycetaceae bacterium]|nr:hypothetical protein [Planctomycetaceae bacterium]